jgi:hypothetical protein
LAPAVIVKVPTRENGELEATAQTVGPEHGLEGLEGLGGLEVAQAGLEMAMAALDAAISTPAARVGTKR